MPLWAARWLAVFAILLSVAAESPLHAQGALPPIRHDPQLAQQKRTLRLDVIVNGEPVGAVAEFVLDPADGSLSATRLELTRAGIKVPDRGGADDLLPLGSLGLPHEYLESRQAVHFKLEASQRVARDYRATPVIAWMKPEISPGFLLNYSVFGGSFRDFRSNQTRFSGANVTLDARVFSSFGVFAQTGIVGSTPFNDNNRFLRLDSTYTYSDPARVLTARAGDMIAGGLTWTRPFRLGGLQLQSDFAMRSDIVTRAVPVLAGTAAVPSMVDVYVNGLKTFSQGVGAGPFSISNLPYLGAGDARVVVRDASGREVEQNVQLTDPARLLRPGLTDFSIETGFARRGYGLISNDYDSRPLASATLRHGFAPWLTLEAHAEIGAGLLNGGAGIVAGLGTFGTLQLAAMASQRADATGFQLYAAWDKTFADVHVSLSTQRSFGRYDDLASVTARLGPAPEPSLPYTALTPLFTSLAALKPPRALDRVSISAPLRFDKGAVSLGFIHHLRHDGVRNQLLTLSYNRPLPRGATLFATAFSDFGALKNSGAFLGLSMPFLPDVHVSGSLSQLAGKPTGTLEIIRPQRLENNTYGWHLRALEGPAPIRTAAASYRSPYGQAGMRVQQFGRVGEGTATFDGSIAVLGGGVFLGNTVNTSFAVVDAGQPGVPVLQDNRVIGHTNGAGKLLVPNLRPFEANSLAIDPSKLPANYDAGNVRVQVAPYRQAGVHVNFAGRASASTAIIVLKGADGKHLPTGSRGRSATGEEFLVGYGGQAYLRDLKPRNEVVVDLGGKDCRASFDFAPQGGQQVIIDHVTCQ